MGDMVGEWDEGIVGETEGQAKGQEAAFPTQHVR